MIAANRKDTRRRIEIVTNVRFPWHGEGPEPEHWSNEPQVGPWQDCGDLLLRFVYVPMHEAEARRLTHACLSLADANANNRLV